MKDTGMKEKGGAGGYVSSIWAPSQFGGYALSEFTNGKYSGWMYTMNGNHTEESSSKIVEQCRNSIPLCE